ncbi:transglutaminase TgpA family protein [Streptomyces sp. KR80]|uniref:transglutaminase TgpA family protein n=1 Tax=Streptomyces sp. KR80 TaxID=3457426 RepID=UPI003FD649A4
MSGRGRITVCAALATLMTAGSLLPLVDPAGWILQAALLLAIVSGAGAVTRRIPLARPLTVTVQTLVALLLLTLLFAREQAMGGVLPGPDVVREFGRLLAEGGMDVGRYAIPAPVTDGIRLLLVGGVLVIGLTVDALAVTYRSAAPAGLPLLALYSVAAGLSQGGARWLWFLLAAGGYLLLLLAEGRDRLSQWGRVFAGSPRGPSRLGAGLEPGIGGPATAPVRSGRRIGAMALGIALLVPAVLPSLSGGLLYARGQGTGTGPGSGTISAVNPLVSLQNSLNQPENREVLTYRTTAESTQDLYLRIVALDRFDGASWKPSERRVTDVPATLPTPVGLGTRVRTTAIETTIAAADWYRQNWLPLPYPATRVGIQGRWRFEPEGRTLVGDRGQTTRGAQYRVSSLLMQPTAAQLATAPPPPTELLREYTQVPDSLPDVVGRTAREVTSGASNAYEEAAKLEDWFSSEGGFSYDTNVETGSGTQAITRFLKAKEGFCVHFSFSMAAMARTLGIPARVAVGFTPGSARADGLMSVGLKDAHAWPELYFEGVGWTRFEPTPDRGTPPAYTLEETPSGGGIDPVAPRPTDSAAPSAQPSASESCGPELKKLGECGTAAQQGGGEPTDRGLPWGSILVRTALVLLILVLPLLPLLGRSGVRRRRLAGASRSAEISPGGTPAGSAEPLDGEPPAPGDQPDRTLSEGEAADRILAAWRELIDSSWDYGILPDDSQTPRQAAARIVTVGRLDDAGAASVHRVADAVEQVLYAPRPRPTAGLAADVRRVRAGLRAQAGPGAQLRASLAPRSAVRVVWACSRWWSGVTARWNVERWLAALSRFRPGRQES